MKTTTLCYIERDNKYLMLYRNKKKDDCNKNKYVGVGGKVEKGESPEDCVLREVKEETSLTLDSFKLRGVVYFISDIYQDEYMFLFTSDSFSGELGTTDEGELCWVEKEKVVDLPLWEGDKVFLKLLCEREEFFSLKLCYKGERLQEAVLDGKKLLL